MKDAAVFLQHIRDAIARIDAYTVGGRRACLSDTLLQDAVMGEIVSHVPLGLRQRYTLCSVIAGVSSNPDPAAGASRQG